MKRLIEILAILEKYPSVGIEVGSGEIWFTGIDEDAVNDEDKLDLENLRCRWDANIDCWAARF